MNATRTRVRRDIVRLVHRGLGLPEFADSVTHALNRAVPFEGTCLLTIDPATLLPTREVVDNGLPAASVPRLTEIEIREPDVNKFTTLNEAGTAAASLSDATGGELDRSLRQRELRRPSGFGDELRAVLADSLGAYGTLTLLREASSPDFTPADVRFVASLAEPLTEGLRRATMIGDAAESDDEAGVLVLGPDGTVVMANGAARCWLDELGADGSGELPPVVHAVAGRTREVGGPAGGDDDDRRDRIARARVRTRAGRWIVVRGSLLGTGAEAPVAVLLEVAHPPELAPLIADAYAFTTRERRITELVAQGRSTNEIAGTLHLSAYTVQDHLKSIFEKSGTSSRVAISWPASSSSTTHRGSPSRPTRNDRRSRSPSDLGCRSAGTRLTLGR